MRELIRIGMIGLALTLAVEAFGQEAQVERLASPIDPSGPNRVICQRARAGSPACEDIRARKIVDAAAAPFSAIGRVNHAGYRKRSHCTGTLIAPRVVLTAAHCLFDHGRKAWIPAEEVVFVAGYQRQSFVAAQPLSHYVMDKAQDPNGAAFDSALGSDWALLVLDEPIEGVGFAALSDRSGTRPASKGLQMAGYAALRPHVLSLAQDCGTPRAGAWPRAMILFCSTMKGDSGAPIFWQGLEGLEIVGVVSAVRGSEGVLQTLVVPSPNFAEALARILKDKS